ncbi:response regulator [Cyclobacterium jeungdonense]|uniref:Response regulator n=1 Tax=Cyclobacterium jeungdonense TaxID=708087 RepID=A0ABT8CCN9_9BACT|nr:response regulator [Cyclobacterium jeungdonense]MDN3690156.1 response regulator [Cyclobacterium jeungdonense]
MIYTILLIEDNLEMAENISAILKLAGYSVIYAQNGRTGVELAQQNHPDLILCDIMMPEMDGFTVLHILSKMEDTSGIPFIFLTAKAEKSDFRAGMNLGADDYISKPFDGVDLLKVIELRLRKKAFRPSAPIQDEPVFNQHAKGLLEFKKLYENKARRIFRKKDLIYMEGQNPNHLFYILKGQVKTYKVNHFGKELIIDIHEEGSFLGYLPLLEDKPYNENAEALVDVEISFIPKPDFLSMMFTNKEVANIFIKMLSNNLEEMENRLLDIAYQSVRQRVAGTLLKIGKQHTGNTENRAISIARRDISSIVGTTTESLNRTLADFKDEKLIEINPDGLKILNLPQLERIVNL